MKKEMVSCSAQPKADVEFVACLQKNRRTDNSSITTVLDANRVKKLLEPILQQIPSAMQKGWYGLDGLKTLLDHPRLSILDDNTNMKEVALSNIIESIAVEIDSNQPDSLSIIEGLIKKYGATYMSSKVTEKYLKFDMLLTQVIQ